MKKNERTVKALNALISSKKKALNALDDDQKALLQETIDALQEYADSLAADDEEYDVEQVAERLKTIVDEKVAAAFEKIAADTPAPVERREGDYLKSTNALHDFAGVLRKSHGKDELRAMWRETLSKNGIVIANGSEEAYLPEIVRGMIADAWDTDTTWLRDLNNTGAKRFAVRANTDAQNVINARAKGHTGHNTKEEQVLNLAAKILDTQAVYKLLPIDGKTVYDDDEALVRYVVSELTKQVRFEIAHCIVVGNDLSGNGEITSFEGIAYDNAGARRTTDMYVSVDDYDNTKELVDEIMQKVIKPLYGKGDILLFLRTDSIFTLRRTLGATGGIPGYMSTEQLASMLGVTKIVASDNLFTKTLANDEEVIAVGLIPSRYFTVGDINAVDVINWPNYMTNQQMYRAEVYAGGGMGVGCASVLYVPE